MDILTWAYFHGALALMAHRLSFLVFRNRYQLSFTPGLEFDKYGFQRFQPGVEFFWQRRMLPKWFKFLAATRLLCALALNFPALPEPFKVQWQKGYNYAGQ